MDILYHLYNLPAYIDLPFTSPAIGAAFFNLLLIFAGLWKWIKIDRIRSRKQIIFLGFFLLITPVLNTTLGLKLSDISGLYTWQSVPEVPAVLENMILLASALPWVMATFFFPSIFSVLLAFVGGTVLSLFTSHSLFTIFVVTLSAILYNQFHLQEYSTPFFRFLRHPFGASLFTGLFVLPISMVNAFFEVNASLIGRLDFALHHGWLNGACIWAALVIASIIAEVYYLLQGLSRENQISRITSPFETTIESKVDLRLILLIIMGASITLLFNWYLACRNVREHTREKMENVASLSADTIPLYFEYGQSLLYELSNSILIPDEVEQVEADLAGFSRRTPFFEQFLLYNQDGSLNSCYPENVNERDPLISEEEAGLLFALQGVNGQFYIYPGEVPDGKPMVSFINGIYDKSGKPVGILIGRASWKSNALSAALVQVLQQTDDAGQEWVLLDQNEKVLFHSSNASVGSFYQAYLPEEEGFFDGVSSRGGRTFNYFIPLNGQNWSMVFITPFEVVQNEVMTFVITNTFWTIILGLLCFWIVQQHNRQISRSLFKLIQDVRKITFDQIDHPVTVRGVDEIGKLGYAIEKMRISVHVRRDEHDRIMKVSKSVPSSLDIRNAVDQVLDACLVEGASIARIILDSSVLIDRVVSPYTAFSAGEAGEDYAFLDEELFQVMQTQRLMVIPDSHQILDVPFKDISVLPAAAVFATLIFEGRYLGVLWIGFDEARTFSDDWLKLIELIVADTSMAVANIRLYTMAEVDRHRFEAALSALPEPVMVFDEAKRLILVNPAALQVPGLISSSAVGSPLNEVVTHAELYNYLNNQAGKTIHEFEIDLHNGRSFQVSVSQVSNNNQTVAGTVCILKEISQYKALDAIKSDFVATVSHDLRSPLAQVSGYVTMLQMVGELNEQQDAYVEKINTGLQEMTHLISNLLDLGRIEAGVGLKIEKTDVNQIVESVIKTLQPRIIQKKQTINITADHEALMFEVDKALINQALMNLIDNAVKFTPVDGRIDIVIHKEHDAIRFEIHDSGIGVAPIDLPHIFDKFYLAGRRDSQNKRGVGLGLSIVMSIAERHKGRAWAESQLGKGSVFYLEIPVYFHGLNP